MFFIQVIMRGEGQSEKDHINLYFILIFSFIVHSSVHITMQHIWQFHFQCPSRMKLNWHRTYMTNDAILSLFIPILCYTCTHSNRHTRINSLCKWKNSGNIIYKKKNFMIIINDRFPLKVHIKTFWRVHWIINANFQVHCPHLYNFVLSIPIFSFRWNFIPYFRITYIHIYTYVHVHQKYFKIWWSCDNFCKVLFISYSRYNSSIHWSRSENQMFDYWRFKRIITNIILFWPNHHQKKKKRTTDVSHVSNHTHSHTCMQNRNVYIFHFIRRFPSGHEQHISYTELDFIIYLSLYFWSLLFFRITNSLAYICCAV